MLGRCCAAGLGAGLAGLGAAVSCTNLAPSDANNALANRVLAAKHRVAICGWPVKGAWLAKDARVASPEALFTHLAGAGYEGIEMSVRDFRGIFFSPDTSDEEVVRRIAPLAREAGVPVLGVLYHFCDDASQDTAGFQSPGNPLHFANPDWRKSLASWLEADKALGAEYVTFQVWLPARYLSTGGEYRLDEEYMATTARRMDEVHRLCREQCGVNCYFETHFDRISEDVVAFADLLDNRCVLGRDHTLEVNADLSHYIFRNIVKGKSLDSVLSRVGHMHQRMARTFGDVSADCPDPFQDWEAKGVTFAAFQLATKALQGGLSSRAIVGEAGPFNLVAGSHTLSLDASLVPLFKKMARYADEQVDQQEAAVAGRGGASKQHQVLGANPFLGGRGDARVVEASA